jgi:hypothetical protein
MSSDLELVVDTKDTYEDEDDIFFTTPAHLSGLKFVKPNSFSKATIQNAHVDDLSAFALTQLFTTLQMGAKATIIISQPVLVMQEYDVKQVEANAVLAGFEDIQVVNAKFTEPKSGKELDTSALVLTKTQSNDRGDREVKTTKQTITTTTTTTNKRRK